MKNLGEVEKNYLNCGILMIIVGVSMLFLNKTNMGIGTIVLGVVFLIFAFVTYAKNKKEEQDSPKTSKTQDKKTSNEKSNH